MTRILMVASEAAPFAKTGGLADVLGSLPPALRTQGEDVAVVIPLYRSCPRSESTRLVVEGYGVQLGSKTYEVAIREALNRGVSYYLVDCPVLFDRDGLYGESGRDFSDNHVRFAVLSRTALDIARRIFRPHILHCHDWQAALAPIYLRTAFGSDPDLLGMKTVFTIHNLGYQGLFGPSILPEIGLNESLFRPEGIEFFGKVNLLKGGVIYSDFVSTVSRSYAELIQTPEYGFGLDGVLRARKSDVFGIVNGVDYCEWDPETDPHLPARYSVSDFGGKLICRRELLREFQLPTEGNDCPLIGIVGRLTSQKGIDVIAAAASEIFREDLLMVALGTGDPEYEDLFRHLASAHPGKFAVRIGYDNRLAHAITAGADMFLMPSRYEPCGLNQIYSLRYGTVPVVRATGGLDDTIDEGTGFKFSEYSPEAMLKCLRSALNVFRSDPERWKAMMIRGMQKDFSWGRTAAEYSKLYQRLLHE